MHSFYIYVKNFVILILDLCSCWVQVAARTRMEMVAATVIEGTELTFMVKILTRSIKHLLFQQMYV